MNHEGNRFKITFTFQPSHFATPEHAQIIKGMIHAEAERLQPLNAGGFNYEHYGEWCELWFVFENPYDAERLHDLGVNLSILSDVPLNPVLKNLCDPDPDPSKGYKCPNGFNYSSRALHDIQCQECPPRRPSE